MTRATYKPRSAWGARPAKTGPGLLTPSRVRGVALHWPGSGETDSFDSDSEVAAALRGWQAFHMDGRGWSDIAYQVAVSQDGDVWTLRGLREQSGANGCNEANEAYVAILLILVAGEEPSAAMKASVRDVVADVRTIYGNDAAEIKPHSVVRRVCESGGTDCPGPAATAAIVRGDFEPWAQPPAPNPPKEHPLSDLTAAEAAMIGKAVSDALTPRLDAIEQKYTVADNNYDSQRAAWTSVGDAYAAHLIAGGPVLPAARLDEIRNQLWSYYRALWTEKS